jgi:hypothetical protein
MEASFSFGRCHLQILRSLYEGQRDEEEHAPLLLGGGDDNSCNVIDDGIMGGESNSSIPDIFDAPPTQDIVKGKKSGTILEDDKNRVKIVQNHDHDVVGNDDVSFEERPVKSEVWDLIELFLQHRMDYRPHKQRQLHWSKISTEAKSRSDHLLSTEEEEGIRQLQTNNRTSVTTPRTPMFTVIRGSTTPHQSSLTPQSSNRNNNPSKTSQSSDRDVIASCSAIPSWNFINHMVQRRSRLCTQSCQSFRSMPFLDELQIEANMRCKTLGKALVDLKMGKRKNKRERVEVVDGLMAVGHNDGKRRKFETKHPVTSSLFLQLCSDKYVISDQSSADDYDEDCIVEMKMKFQLWTSLLSSLKEIVD